MSVLREIMTPEVHTLQLNQKLIDAIKFLHDHKVRHIPIVDSEGALVGVLTDRDVKRATPSPLAPNQREVWENVVTGTDLERVMSRDPITATGDTTLIEALHRLVEDRIGCLPILEDGKLVGIVTARDLFRASLTALEAAQS
ncbi:MAG: CBS domain-containing protein [Planctomycetes bacterium]|nr:CBS domain-containing protein [Planctomycetota bacterium]